MGIIARFVDGAIHSRLALAAPDECLISSVLKVMLIAADAGKVLCGTWLTWQQIGSNLLAMTDK